MKRALIGAAFFIGGALLLNAAALGVSGEVGLFGAAVGLAGMVLLVFELLTKDEKKQ